MGGEGEPINRITSALFHGRWPLDALNRAWLLKLKEGEQVDERGSGGLEIKVSPVRGCTWPITPRLNISYF